MSRLLATLFCCGSVVSASAAETTLNLEMVFDSSGSMASKIGEQAKIESAYTTIEYVTDALPENSQALNVGFRVFGQAGDNSEAKKAESCASTKLTVPLKGIDKPALYQQSTTFKPAGWTPLALALTEAGKDFPAAADGVRNVVLLVSDGEETCGGDPCAAAQALAASKSKTVVHVVGFGMSPEESRTLQCIPKATGGLYLDAENGDALAGAILGLLGEEVRLSGRSFEVDASLKVPIPNIVLGAENLSLPGVVVEGGGTDDDDDPNEVDEDDKDEEKEDDDQDSSFKLQGLDVSGISLGGIPGLRAQPCKPDQTDCNCPTGSNCILECPQGGCQVDVAAGSNATILCPAGNCKIQCAAGSNCLVDCPTGRCEVQCATGANCTTHKR